MQTSSFAHARINTNYYKRKQTGTFVVHGRNMVSEIIIPNMGANIEEGTILEWYVGEDDMVYFGDALFCYETTKGTFDIEAEQDGIIFEILHRDGIHKPLAVVGYIGEEGDEMPG